MKKGKYLLDTNVFLGLLVGGRGGQNKDCFRLFERVKNGELAVSACSVVILEIYYTLKSFYKLSAEQCEEYLGRILEMKNVLWIDDYDYPKALLYLREKRVKFSDCLIASLDFFQDGGKIISYDRDFDKLGIKRLEPGEVRGE